jgi:hypothetical protein
MLDYDIMNQIHFFCRKKLWFERKGSNVTASNTQTKTTLSERELYTYKGKGKVFPSTGLGGP